MDALLNTENLNTEIVSIEGHRKHKKELVRNEYARRTI